MRILISSAGPFTGMVGGGQIYTHALAKGLITRGHEIFILSSRYSHEFGEKVHLRQIEVDSLPVFDVTIHPGRIGPGPLASQRDPDLVAALRDVIRRVRPEFLHLNGMYSPLATIAKEEGIPHLGVVHHPGEACPKGDLLRPDDSICRLAANPGNCIPCFCRQIGQQRRFEKCIGALLGSVPRAITGWWGRRMDRVLKTNYLGRLLLYPYSIENQVRMLKDFHAHIRMLVSPSRAMANVLVRNGVAPERIRVIPHGIPPGERFPWEWADGRPIRFGFIGRIDRAKGVHVLLEAFRRASGKAPCELHIFGDAQGTRDTRYLRRIRHRVRHVPGIFWHGMVKKEEIPSRLAFLDVLVLAPIYLEVFGLVVAEAFAAGRPVIVSDCGGPAEQVTHGLNGLIVPPRDPEALAAAMESLAAEPRRIRQLVENLSPVDTLENYVTTLESLYLELGENRI